MTENGSENIGTSIIIDEKELIKRCTTLADSVCTCFQQHFGSFRKCLSENSIPSVLGLASIAELRDVLEHFIRSISKNRKLTAKERADLANYGIRAFTVSILKHLLYLYIISGSRLFLLPTSQTVFVYSSIIQAFSSHSEGPRSTH